jgi:hypothetical protein
VGIEIPLAGLIVGIIVIFLLLYFAVRFVKNCLPRIVVGLIILGVLAYLIYKYVVQ